MTVWRTAAVSSYLDNIAKILTAAKVHSYHQYQANFAEEAKAQADGMVEDLRAAFKELVGETDWMDEATQVRAVLEASSQS